MIKKIMITCVVILVLGLVFRDFMIKGAIESVGSSVLGAPVKVGQFSLSLLTGRVYMKDFKIHNPSGFSNNPLIDIDHIEVKSDLLAIIQGKLYFSLIDINIRQLAIEQNKHQLYNVASLKTQLKRAISL